jgi:hypothetical protein
MSCDHTVVGGPGRDLQRHQDGHAGRRRLPTFRVKRAMATLWNSWPNTGTFNFNASSR